MIVTAWNNGKHHKSGAGYGFRVSRSDRDRWFQMVWTSVIVTLPTGEQVEANINKSSFWTQTCRELISQQFGAWLIQHGYAPWVKGHPPKFELTQNETNQFTLEGDAQ